MKKLKLKDLVFIGTGHVIGAGVVTIVGSALNATGYSTWLAFLFTCLLSFFRIVPFLFFSNALVLPGGKFSIITGCLGDEYGAFITISSMLLWLSKGIAVLALSEYLTDMMIIKYPKILTIVIWLFFIVMNLMGIDSMSKIQSIATPLLLIALFVFSFICIKNMQTGYLDFSSEDMFLNGASGFFNAVVLLSYSCDGVISMVNYSKECENPKQNIPKSMIIITIIITITYTIVGFASGAVLPLEYTAGATLIRTAKYIMPPVLFSLFLIFGPVCALTTTMNAGIPDAVIPVGQGAKSGWLPKVFAKKNKYGVYYFSIISVFFIGCIPITFNLSIEEIVSFIFVLSSINTFLILLCSFKFPIVYKKEWQNSKLYVSNFYYYFLIFIFCVIEIFMVLTAIKNLNFTILVFIFIIIVFSFLYAYSKLNKNKNS